MQILFEKARQFVGSTIEEKKNKLSYKKILKIVGVMAHPSKHVFFLQRLAVNTLQGEPLNGNQKSK